MAGECGPPKTQPETKQCTTEFAKKACHILDKIWNSNMQATIGDISRLFWAQGFCNLFCSLILISFSGICSTRKYDEDCDGDPEFLEEDDRQSLAVLCVIVGLMGIMQSAINGATLARILLLIAPQTELSKAWLRQMQAHPTLGYEARASSTVLFSDPQQCQQSARRFRIRSVVFALSTVAGAVLSGLAVTYFDAWYTDFGLVLGGYMASQIVHVGFLLRGAFVKIDGKTTNEQCCGNVEIGGSTTSDGGVDGEKGLLMVAENEVAQLGAEYGHGKSGSLEEGYAMTVEV